ncbi:hypothetical protein ACHAWT_001983 [Skeletonema menzelii]
MKNNTPKYMSSIGQNTGTSNTEKNVITSEVAAPRAQAIQNLNSGNRRANGRYSFPSLAVEGRLNPSSRCPPTSEGDEIVEEEDAQAVGYDEVSLDEVDSEEENCEEKNEEYPSGDDVYGGFVEPVLNGAADC